MTDVLVYALVPLALAAVALVLLFGFLNFARGGSPQLSQRLMRWRVLLQFVALVVIMFTIWVLGR
jgi:Hypoxia induced protein conserved region